ncbi:HNH endonuclease [Intrasporangium sp.]|uniref:HNH endonuclease n=1 Tax=Intrasporangium sp. TaxID=1925024 RepID=UPI00264903A9|nr:HNH endonuclease [Intrasporangium sp.]
MMCTWTQAPRAHPKGSDAMKAYVFPTDSDWAAFLRANPEFDEVNFWLPSAVTFKALQVGDRFVYRSKSAVGGRLIGGGLYEGHVRMRVSDAWRFYGEANGCATRDDMLRSINHYRARNGQPPEADPQIGCILIRDSFFVPQELEVPVPPSYQASAVRGRGYDPQHEDWSYLEAAFVQLLVGARVPDLRPDADVAAYIEGPTRGLPRLMAPRLGQKGFKSLVLSSYHGQCAITGARITPTLEAAHIRPVAAEGQHRVDNGLLLRSDVHLLFDAGYLGVDERHRLHVSKRLQAEFGNGEEFYSKAGQPIAVPDRNVDRPNREAVQWHMDTVFLAS